MVDFGYREDTLELLEQFEEDGYCTRECPVCHSECEPTEIDNDYAFCPNCNKPVKVERLV